MSARFHNRADAGRQLAQQLILLMQSVDRERAIAIGVPRGGVPVAAEIAAILQIPLDICLVHKLGVPGNAEVAMGAIDARGNRYLNAGLVQRLGISAASIERIAQAELAELHRRERVYRGNRPPLDLKDRIAIVVDDGLATGATMKMAIRTLAPLQPRSIVVAAPIASRSAIAHLRESVANIVCSLVPEPFYAIGSWYDDFSQTTDDLVRAALDVSG